MPESHPLRPVRKMVNTALAKMDALFSHVRSRYRGGRPSIAPEKLLRASCCKCCTAALGTQLMEQVQYNLLFRWFIGLSMDDEVWVPSVFTKNRERLIEHDAVIEFFNEVLKIADKKHWLSGEHFSVDGTLIQAWAGHKSFVRKDDDDAGGGGDGDPGADANGNGGNFKGQRRATTPMNPQRTPMPGCTAKAKPPASCATWATP
ncbi:transposase [Acidovorax sp.]|uniref:transposase n=1 Tax=Acidovorax sp. TaxID=1872122 RepID=UPI002ACE3A9D|nr:transposase [Acidovorax sp.]MDZ7867288.1 transposase [Acidovorax sp.]